MKIIHVVLGKANPNRMNGVNKVANQLATTMTDLGKNIELWGIANTLKHDYPPRNYKTVLFQQSTKKWSLDPSLTKAIKHLTKFTVVHFHGSFIPEFFLMARLLKKKKIPFVYTPHGALTEGAMQKSALKKRLYFSIFESFIVKNALKVQLLGEGEANHLNTLIQTENTCLIPNGQVTPKGGPWKKQKPMLYDSLVFGFCGRLDQYHKGLDNLLAGFKEYLAKGYQGTLELIGDGKDREILEKLTRALGLQQSVVFHGALFGDAKFKVLADFDVFMHPSRMEGFPTAVLEAAAIGKPCITSEATNVNPYIKLWKAGIPIKESNPENVSLAMKTALEFHQNGTLHWAGQNARNMIEKEFTWEHIAQQLIEVYEGKR